MGSKLTKYIDTELLGLGSINRILRYVDYNRSKFWLALVAYSVSGALDFFLLSFTGYLFSIFLGNIKPPEGVFHSYELIALLYALSVVMRIAYSLVTYRNFLDVIFDIRLKYSTRYVDKRIGLFPIKREDETTNVLLPYLNEYTYSVCLPLATLITESAIVLATVSLLTFLYGVDFIVFIIVTLVAVLPVKYLISMSKLFGLKKLIIEKGLFKEIDSYVTSRYEVNFLGIKIYLLGKAADKLSAWMALVKGQLYYNNLPKLYFENLVYISLLIVFVYSVVNGSDKIDRSILLIYILPLMRTLPAVARISSALQQIRYGLPHLDLLSNLLVKDDVVPRDSKHPSAKYLLQCAGVLTVKEKGILINDFRLEFGKVAQISGTSGIGKSTFLRALLTSFYCDRGLMVGWNSNIGPEGIAYLPDRPLIVSDTIRNNILLGTSNIASESLDAVLDICLFDDAGMGSLLDTNCEFDGSNISTGQRQRIGLARALLKNPKLLIVDEGISNITKAHRNTIIKKISETGCAVILVDHGNIYVGEEVAIWTMSETSLELNTF